MAEEKILALLLDQNHFFLIVGIFAFLYILKAIKPVGDFLFSEKWKWLVPIVNLALSFIGVFAVGMTSATSLGMKIIVALVITAFTAYSYELTKPVFKGIAVKFFGKSVKTDG
jgi:hypothetical protein